MQQNIDDLLSEWRSWLYGDDSSCITNQLLTLLRHTAAFRILVDSDRVADDIKHYGPIHNSLFRKFVHNGYVGFSSVRIRSIVDKNVCDPPKSATKNDRSVISLYRLFYNLKDNYHRLSREVLARGRYNVEYFNQCFNQLCDYSIEPSPSNIFPAEIFDRVFRELDQCNTICDVADKYFAHAASPTSRTQAPTAELAKIGDFLPAISILCKVYSLAYWILDCRVDISHYLPTNDLLICLDQPIVTSDNSKAVVEKALGLSQDVSGWIKEGWQHFRIEQS